MIEAKLYLTGVILLLAGIFIGATFKTGVDDRFFQLLGGNDRRTLLLLIPVWF